MVYHVQLYISNYIHDMGYNFVTSQEKCMRLLSKVEIDQTPVSLKVQFNM